MVEGARREEILQTAATMLASSGLRTSLHDIADACGILPGSLYHHFTSKEAMIVELVQRYLDELDRVAADALVALRDGEPQTFERRIVDFGEAIAHSAARHRAALILTLYEPPSGAGEELAKLARRTPEAIHGAMHELLEAGLAAREIRSGVDLSLVSQRLCQSMLHVGVGVYHQSPGAESIPAMKCRIVLHGLAVHRPAKRALDASPAMRAVRELVATWAGDDDDSEAGHLRSVARTEFTRRGYETTTVRDVAAAAGLSTSTVYRHFGSKDELLASAMGSYPPKADAVWNVVTRSASAPLEKLDALAWAYIVIFDRFSEEFRIQLAWLRQSPPSSANLDASFRRELRHLKAILTEGTRSGELRLVGGTYDVKARAVMELLHMPETIVRVAGVSAAHELARDTLLRGCAPRS